MKTEATKYGMQYHFDNGCVLSVIKGWAAMADDEHPLEFMLFTPWGNTDAIGYQTQEQIDYIITICKNNIEKEIKEVVSRYIPNEPEESDYPEEDHEDCLDNLEDLWDTSDDGEEYLDYLNTTPAALAVIHTAFGGPEGNTLYWYIDFYDIDTRSRALDLELRGQDKVPSKDEIKSHLKGKGYRLLVMLNH